MSSETTEGSPVWFQKGELLGGQTIGGHSSIPVFIWTLPILSEDSELDALCYLHTLGLSLRPEAGTPPHCPVTSPVGGGFVASLTPLGSPLSLCHLPIQRQLSPPTACQAVPELDYQGSRGHKPKGSHKDQLKNNPLLSIMRRSLHRNSEGDIAQGNVRKAPQQISRG